jgi:predicted nucleotidyltransferase
MILLSRNKLRAFLTPVAFYRAIKGSYSLESIKALIHGEKLTENEWEEAVRLYKKHLGEEQQRNQAQAKEHARLVKKLAPSIQILKKITKKIPEITDVLLVNSFSFGALKPTSDIDIVVICEPKLIWWARLKLTIALERAHLRRKPGNIEEHICLSFFVTTDALSMESLAIDNDLYLRYWSANTLPLFGRHRSNWLKENQWLLAFLPHLRLQTPPKKLNRQISFLSYLANSLVRIPMYQRSKAKAAKLGIESSIVVSDQILKFHNQDRRQLYRDKTLVELAALEQLF